MKIREFVPDDYDQAHALAVRMHEESTFSVFPFVSDQVEKIANSCLANDDLVALVAEMDGVLVGILVGFATEHFFSDARYASDLVIYVHPDYRGSTAAIRLMATFEGWARARGCVELRIGAATGINPEKTDRFYKGIGYRECGVQYSKTISPLSTSH
jgi:GNAT superfamily N-acetyltransferase